MKKQITIPREQLDVINHLIKHEHLSYTDAVEILNSNILLIE